MFVFCFSLSLVFCLLEQSTFSINRNNSEHRTKMEKRFVAKTSAFFHHWIFHIAPLSKIHAKRDQRIHSTKPDINIYVRTVNRIQWRKSKLSAVWDRILVEAFNLLWIIIRCNIISSNRWIGDVLFFFFTSTFYVASICNPSSYVVYLHRSKESSLSGFELIFRLAFNFTVEITHSR